MEYKLYKHKTKANKWLVVRTLNDIDDNYLHVYDVKHLDSGDTRYTEIKLELFN